MKRSGKFASLLLAAFAGALLVSGPALAERGDRDSRILHKTEHQKKHGGELKEVRYDKKAHYKKGHRAHGPKWHKGQHRKWHRAERRHHKWQHRDWRHGRRHHYGHRHLGHGRVIKKVIRNHYRYYH